MRKLLTFLALAAVAGLALANTPAHQMLASYGGDVISVSGTSPSPNTATGECISDPTGCNTSAGWRWVSDGTVDRLSGFGSPTWSEFTSKPEEWVEPENPTTTYYIRASSCTVAPAINTMSSVSALTSTQTIQWNASCSAFSIDSSAGTCFIEIFSDAGGTDVLDSGYYRGNAFCGP